MKKFNFGFTLVELLVVISIIGLISAITLAALNSARSKGSDATIRADLNTIFKQAEIVYDNASPNNYANVCSNGVVQNAIQSASQASAGYDWITNGNTRDYNCTNALTTWVAVIKLKTSGAGWLCMDNTKSGVPKVEPSQPNLVITVCP